MDIYSTLLGASFITLIVLFGIAIVTLPLAITWASTSTLFFALPILFSSYF